MVDQRSNLEFFTDGNSYCHMYTRKVGGGATLNPRQLSYTCVLWVMPGNDNTMTDMCMCTEGRDSVIHACV